MRRTALPGQPMLVRLLLVAALVLVGAAHDVRSAYACSCIGRSTAEALGAADAVFAGTVADTEDERDGWALRFVVSRVYKGTVYTEQVVHTPDSSASCGIDAASGSRWIIFATAETVPIGDQVVTRLHTGLCSGTVRDGRPLRELGDPRPPLKGESDQIEQTLQTDAAVSRAVVLGGVGALALGLGLAAWIGLAWRRKRSG